MCRPSVALYRWFEVCHGVICGTYVSRKQISTYFAKVKVHIKAEMSG